MHDLSEIRDLRFEGMDIPELMHWIGQIKQGRGIESMHNAVESLGQAVQVVVDLDETLRSELGKLHIAWEGHAASLAKEATAQQAEVVQQAQDPLHHSALSVRNQGDGYNAVRNALPNPDELRHKQSENFFEWIGGAFGYESDYDKEAKTIDGQKKTAQAALASYRNLTVNGADSFQPLPDATTASTSAQPAEPAPASSASAVQPGDEQSGFSHAGHGFPAAQSTTASRAGEFSGAGGPGSSPSWSAVPDAQKPAPGAVAGGSAVAASSTVVAGAAAAATGMLPGVGKGGGPDGGTPRSGGFGHGGEPGRPIQGGGPGTGGYGEPAAGRVAGSLPPARPVAGPFVAPVGRRPSQGEEDKEHSSAYDAGEPLFEDDRLVSPTLVGQPPGERAPEPPAGAENRVLDEAPPLVGGPSEPSPEPKPVVPAEADTLSTAPEGAQNADQPK